MDREEFAALIEANLAAAQGIAASYQLLLGGVPNAGGFSFLIGKAVETNFGSYRQDIVFNDENVFINLTNNLVLGNAEAQARFQAMTGGATSLAGQVEAFYRALVPAEAQSEAGLAFMTRPEALRFYAEVAAERGIAGDDGAAVVALASLLRILVEQDIGGLGDDVNDFIAAIGDGSASLPLSGETLTDIDTADGTRFDDDERAPDTTAPAVTIVGLDRTPAVGETATLTIVFSEPVTGLAVSDFEVTGGILSVLRAVEGQPGTYTAIFTATQAGPATIALTGGYEDLAGNAGEASGTVSLGTIRPGTSEPGPDETGPVFSSGATASVAENGPVVTAVYTAAASDPSDPVTYALGGADAALFDLDTATGALTFRASPDFEAPGDTGADNVYDVTITASDSLANTTSQAVAITVTDADDTGPVFTSGATANFAENGLVTTAVYTAAADDTNGPVAYALGGADAARFDLDTVTGVLTFRASPDFEAPVDAGADNVYDVTITASDSLANTTSQAVAITVTNANDAPAAQADTNAVTEDASQNSIVGNVLANDGDDDGNTLVVVTTGAFVLAHGSLALTANGGYTYTLNNNDPSVNALNAGGTLNDSFNYTISDGHGGTASSSLTITISGANDAPTGAATASLANGTEDLSYTVTAAELLAGFSDADGGTLAVANLTSSAGGTVSGTGPFTITLPAHFSGPVTLSYDVIDGQGGSTPATQTFGVAPVNDAPVAVADTNSIKEDTIPNPISGNVLTNDSDVEGSPLVVTGTGAIALAYGSLTLNADGSYTYMLDNENAAVNALGAGDTLSDDFSYTVSDGQGGTTSSSLTITINGTNDAPVASDDSYVTDEDTPLTITLPGVLANDTDTENDTLTAFLVAGPAHGALTLNTDGSFTYTPTGNYHGADSFTYRVNDGTADGNTATVSLTVNAVNDAPVGAPTATLANGTEDTPYIVSIDDLRAGFSDPDGTPLAVQGLTSSQGSVTYNGDGTYTIDLPANYNGPVTLSYSVFDGPGATIAAEQSFTVDPVNDLPVASDDSYVTDEDTPLTITLPGVLANDTDTENDTLTAFLVAGPAHGALTLNTDGSFTYTPTGNYHGADSFTYRVNDGTADGNTATVSLTVNAVNDAPVGAPTATLANGTEDTPYIVSIDDLRAGFSDPDGTPLAVQGLTSSQGSVTYNGDGTYTIDLPANYNGPVTLSYSVFDSLGATIAAELSFTVDAADEFTRVTSGINHYVYRPVISADGSTVTFYSYATNITIGGDANGGTADVFVYDIATDDLTNVTETGDGISVLPSISADGSKITFYSYATNLAPSDTNGQGDILLYDIATGIITNVSDGGNGQSDKSVISADGSVVVFQSDASNLVSGQTDTNGAVQDILLYDVGTGDITNITRSGNFDSYDPVVSADGSKVAFSSVASNLSGHIDINGTVQDILLYDASTGDITNITESADGNSYAPIISADGSTIVFFSSATNLVPGHTDANGNTLDIFVYDVGSGDITNVTGIGNAPSYNSVVSADGSIVVFYSSATNLVPGHIDTNGSTADIFVYDIATGAITNITEAGDGASSGPIVSADGSTVVFHSDATNLVPGHADTNGSTDVFAYDVASGTITNITGIGNGGSQTPVISADGSTYAFLSNASNLTSDTTATTFADLYLFHA